MIDRKEIELLVRAQLKGQKDIGSITTSIKDLEAAINGQTAAAKRGESSIDELKASLTSLEKVQASLASNRGSLKAFDELPARIERAEAAVTKAASAYEKYRSKLGDVSKASDDQQKRLDSLYEKQQRAQSNVEKLRRDQEVYGESLKQLGFDIGKLSDSYDKLAKAELEAARVRQQADQLQNSYAQTVRAARDEIKRREQAEREAIATAEKFAAAEKKAAEASRQRAADAARVAQVLSDRKAASAAAGNEFGSMSEEASRARELAALRQDIIRRSEEQVRVEKELAQNSALKKTADDAEKAAKGYTSLARASADLTPKTQSLSAAIASIIDPANKSVASISKIESEVQSLAEKTSKINGPIKDYQATLRSLSDVSKGISGQAALVDDFRRQTEALRAARTEFAAARAKVTEYAAAVRQGGDAGQAFTRALEDAQRKATTAAAALQQQLVATRESRAALREAGVATNDLAAAETRLTNAARTATTATTQLADAKRRYGVATRETGAALASFNDGGRTTLSLLQRIRGEVLSLVTAYVGLQGGIRLAGNAIKAVSEEQGTKNQLGISVGNNKEEIDAEYEYVKAQSKRIGLEYDTAAKGYAKFAAAASKSGSTRQEIRYIWESFAEVGRVANLSADDMNGVFKALEQMASKGKIQAEELRGQLGDRLFGAFMISAEALKGQFPDLDKAMKNGQVTAEHLVDIAEQFRKTVADQLPAAINSILAEEARLHNAFKDFEKDIADGGFSKAYLNMLGELTTFLEGDVGKKFAEGLTEAFTAVADGIVYLIKHTDELKLALEVLATFFTFKFALAGVQNIQALGGSLSALESILKASGAEAVAAGGKFGKLFAFLKAGLGVVASFAAGWEFGTYLSNNFEVAQKAGIALVTGLESLWVRLKYGVQEAFADLPTFVENVLRALVNEVTEKFQLIAGLAGDLARAVNLDDVAAKFDKLASGKLLEPKKGNQQAQAIRAQMEADLAAIRDIGTQMWADVEKKFADRSKPVVKAIVETTEKPAPRKGKGNGGKDGPSEAEIKKRESQIESITRALEGLEAKIDRAQTDTLSKQLEAVDLEYAKLARQIKKLGGEAGTGFMQRLTETTGQLRTQITKKFNDDLLKEQEALQHKLEQLEASTGRKQKSDLQARLDAVKLSYEQTYRDIAAYKTTLEQNNMPTENADQMKARVDAGVKELQNLETQKFYKDELKRYESELNDLLSVRADRLKTIEDLETAGLITAEEAKTQTDTAITDMQPRISALVDIAREFAISLQGAFDPTALDAFLAKLTLIQNSEKGLDKELKKTKDSVDQITSGAITGGIDAFAKSMGEAVAGTKSLGDAFKDAGASFLQFAADFMRQIAEMIIKAMVLKAIENSSWGGWIAGAVAHTGAVVGERSTRTRNVSPLLFANAPRYHGGGVVGLSPDEYPAILKKNEEVLTDSDPRNVLNGGMGGNSSAAVPQDVTIVNTVDGASFLESALSQPAGRRIISNYFSANRSEFRTLLGVK